MSESVQLDGVRNEGEQYAVGAPRLGLLVCDKSLPSILTSKQNFQEVVSDFLRDTSPLVDACLSPSDLRPKAASFDLDAYDVVDAQEYPNLESGRYAGVIISAYDDLPWIKKLLLWVADTIKLRPEVKIIGICFGHQVVALAMGGVVAPNSAWEMGVTEIHLSSAGKAVLHCADEDIVSVQELHRDHVVTPPPSFLVLGQSASTLIQGLILPMRPESTVHSQQPFGRNSEVDVSADVHVLTVQGHPEFPQQVVLDIIDAFEGLGVIDNEAAQEGRRKASGTADAVKVMGRAIWKVLGVY